MSQKSDREHIARLVVYGLDEMHYSESYALSEWLIRLAKEIKKDAKNRGSKYSGRFIARYMK